MLDFPSSPTTGQKYPSPSVAGVPVYTWDGEKWGTPSGPNTFTDAPTDGALYGRQSAGWVYAAPADALGWSGMQINGSMEVSQEKGTATTSTNGTYIIDGWQLNKNGTLVIAAQQGTNLSFCPGIPYQVFITVSTAQASLGAGDIAGIYQSIEGWRVARLAFGQANAQSITIGFWSGHHRTGVYSGSVRNGASNRSYAFTYTQTVADIAQYNTITIPGDTTGTWAIDNTTGMIIAFAMAVAVGGTYTAPSANTWLSGNYIAAPTQINGVAATSDVFRITGVVVLPGIEVPSAARSPFIMRPFTEELRTCERYYQRIGGVNVTDIYVYGYAAATNNIAQTMRIPTMRTSPTAAQAGTFTYFNLSTVGLIASPTTLAIALNSIPVTGATYMFSNTPAPIGSITLDARL